MVSTAMVFYRIVNHNYKSNDYYRQFLVSEKASTETVELKGLYKDLPQLEKVLKPDDKKLLENFINEKVSKDVTG